MNIKVEYVAEVEAYIYENQDGFSIQVFDSLEELELFVGKIKKLFVADDNQRIHSEDYQRGEQFMLKAFGKLGTNLTIKKKYKRTIQEL